MRDREYIEGDRLRRTAGKTKQKKRKEQKQKQKQKQNENNHRYRQEHKTQMKEIFPKTL